MIKKVELIRCEQSKAGTFGVLQIDKIVTCVTLERPWKNNAVNVSCVPAGDYMCKRINSPRHGITFEVENVKGRTHILFHIGNRIKNSKGCILTGSRFGVLGKGRNKGRAVLDSTKAFNNFMKIMENENYFPLTIRSI